jgi:hypothetical protein
MTIYKIILCSDADAYSLMRTFKMHMEKENYTMMKWNDTSILILCCSNMEVTLDTV